MNKTTKASIGAGAAALLLLGGAGSLAYWNDAATVSAGSVNSGYLTLDDGSCDAGWVYAAGKANAGNPVVNIVPGDVITKKCTFVVGAKGDNLSATPTIPSTVALTSAPKGAAGGTGTVNAVVGATYTLAGTAYSGAPITQANDGNSLVATINVQIPFGTTTLNGNDTQLVTATLNALTVSLAQTNPNA